MLLRFAQACGETIAIEASGERDAAGDASQDASAQDDRWNALTSELAAMRAETAQLRQTVAAQTNSDPVHAELAKLRDEIVNLRP